MDLPPVEMSKAVCVERARWEDLDVSPRNPSGGVESELGLWTVSRGGRSGLESLQKGL